MDETQQAIDELIQKEFSINTITMAKINLPIQLASRKREDLPAEALEICAEVVDWLDVFCARKSKEKFIIFSGARSDIMCALAAKGMWVRRRRVFVASGTEVAEWMQSHSRDEVFKKLIEADVLVVRDVTPITTNRFEQEDAIGMISMVIVRRFESRAPTVFCLHSRKEMEVHYAKPFKRIGEYGDQVKVFKWGLNA